jgi:DNA (cytosine-5)-methyltransferase 1
VLIRSMTRSHSDGSKKNFAVLDLFSGIGGFSLGLEAAGPFRTVAFCEQDAFCQAVIRKHWPDVPIYDDVRALNFGGEVDVITGGYPCQPFSVAGKQKGAADDRHLWPSMFEIIKHKRPRWVVAENVAGHIAMGLDEVLFDLEGEGYTARPIVIPACAVDAPHRRDRVWIIAAKDDADTNGKRPHRAQFNEQREAEPADGQKRFAGQVREVLAGRGDAGQRHATDVANAIGQRCGKAGGAESGRRVGGTSSSVADADSQRGRGGDASRKNAGDVGQSPRHTRHHTGGVEPWLPEPDVGRVAHGVPNRVDRLKALGNAVVPQVVTQIGRAILAAEGA